MSKKAIFLDRDGVINKEVNYLFKIEDFEFIDGIFDACLYFQNLGYAIIIVTNQSGIARKYYTESDYQKVTKWMLRSIRRYKNIRQYLDIFHCPHGPDSTYVIAGNQIQACFIKAKTKAQHQIWKNPG